MTSLKKQNSLLKVGIGWGFCLWLVGYILGIAAFMLVPANMIGWVVSPIGIVVTLLVLTKKIRGNQFEYFLKLALVWTSIAIVLDYLFIVKLFANSHYYKPDVYFYYLSTFVLPLIVQKYRSLTKKK